MFHVYRLQGSTRLLLFPAAWFLWRSAPLTGTSHDSKGACFAQIGLLRESVGDDNIFHGVNCYNGYRFYVRVPGELVIGSGNVYDSMCEREKVISVIRKECL
jgi:hypothetical protein